MRRVLSVLALALLARPVATMSDAERIALREEAREIFTHGCGPLAHRAKTSAAYIDVPA